MAKKKSYHCEECNKDSFVRNDEYDAYFCPHCLKWLEDGCTDPECTFCAPRPDKAPKP